MARIFDRRCPGGKDAVDHKRRKMLQVFRTDGFYRGADRRHVAARTHLAHFIISPGINGAVILEGKGVIVSRRDRRDIRQASNHGSGRSPLIRRAIPQLTVEITAPGIDRTVCFESDGVDMPCGDGHDTGQINHGDRRKLLIGRAVTQLTISIAPPRVNGTVCFERNGVIPARGDRSHAGQVNDSDR